MKKLLWLDDYRDPMINDWLVFSPIHRPFETIWVKNYKEFVTWIEFHGLPDGICFDNDLGEEMEGKDCAKWLNEYCLDNDLDLPAFNIQSANGPAADFIRTLLNNYNKYRNEQR